MRFCPDRWLGIVLAGVLCGCPLLAQDATDILVSPAVANLKLGESRNFRATDKNGHILRGVEWTASQAGVLKLIAGDEVEVTAMQSGKCTLIAHLNQASGDAQVEVLEGSAMKPGTVLWSAPTQLGCTSIQIVQATPTADGPDLYQTSACPDGTYVTALTSDGILLWRKKLGSEGKAPSLAPSKSIGTVTPVTATPAVALNTHAKSICDAVSVGSKKEAIRDLVKERGLPPPADSPNGPWLIEEDSVQCKFWFDSDARVTRKQKILVAQ
jgi:hypothetical protein